METGKNFNYHRLKTELNWNNKLKVKLWLCGFYAMVHGYNMHGCHYAQIIMTMVEKTD